jgi:hypothetical protein
MIQMAQVRFFIAETVNGEFTNVAKVTWFDGIEEFATDANYSSPEAAAAAEFQQQFMIDITHDLQIIAQERFANIDQEGAVIEADCHRKSGTIH